MSRRIEAYGLAAALSLASIALLWVLDRQLTDPPVALLLVPVVVVAYRWSFGPGLLAVALMTTFAIVIGEDASLGVAGVVICAVIEALHRARARERVARIAVVSSERRFHQLFHASPLPLSLSRISDGLVVEVNAAYLTLFGIRREEILGHSPCDIGVLVGPERRAAMFVQLGRGESIDAEFDAPTRAGMRSLRVRSCKVEVEGVAHAFTTFVDDTEHRADREALRAGGERLRELAENLHEVLWLTDPENQNILYISPSYEDVYDRSSQTLATDPRDWLNAVHPEDRARMAQLSLVALAAPQEEQFRIVRKDGTVRTIRAVLSPIFDDDGVLVRIAGVGNDITDRLVLEAQVRETQKLESLGLLAGGVAHDFNNVLAVIAANASLLGESLPPPHPDAELVDEIESAVGRATSLTRQLLAFSRKQAIEPVVLDLNHAVNDTRKMLRRMVGDDISITTSLEPDLAHVLIDPGYLVQVIMNLAVNARDAMPRGGSITLTSRNVTRGGAPWVVLEVSDTGSGMAPEVMSRVFEPFFTTKDVGRGTGLGLSVVHGIVEQAGGTIEVASQLGIGTTLKILLPATDAPAEQISDIAVHGALGDEKILLVDDDTFVRIATSRSLRARGYHVIEASDGAAALRMLRDHAADVSLLVTDVVMPGMDGRELAERAQLQCPSLKVLYISGYTDDAIHHGLATSEVAILEKPFRGYALAGKVRQILDHR